MKSHLTRLSLAAARVLEKTSHPEWIGNREAVLKALQYTSGYGGYAEIGLADPLLGWVPGNLRWIGPKEKQEKERAALKVYRNTAHPAFATLEAVRDYIDALPGYGGAYVVITKRDSRTGWVPGNLCWMNTFGIEPRKLDGRGAEGVQ